MKKFPASLSRASNVITILFYILIIAVLFLQFNGQLDVGPYADQISILIFIVTAGGSYLFKTNHYSLSDQKIIIVKPFWKSSIAFQEITAIERMPTAFSLKIIGSNGVWGYYGFFWSKARGWMTYNFTDPGNIILITTKSKGKYCISPDNPEEFIQTFKSLTRKLN